MSAMAVGFSLDGVDSVRSYVPARHRPKGLIQRMGRSFVMFLAERRKSAERKRAVRELALIDDRLLSDLGLRRYDVIPVPFANSGE
jgi:uncharacterized protein YjiS (DUF1127 family)